jgi:glycerol-1-phosphate dehydrogenase [NAD(P)+]
MNAIETYVGTDAIERLIALCTERNVLRVTGIADENTCAALGTAVVSALEATGLTVTMIVLPGDVIADERTLMQVFVRADTSSQILIAIGAGTITDIVRFAAHVMRLPFVALPTAPSMDGYASSGAPLVVEGVKRTYMVESPIAVLSHLPTLCRAPQAMIAAGLGDMLGKYSSLADWQLGALLWQEPYDAATADRTRAALQACIMHATELRTAEPTAIAALINGLLESGLSIRDVGHSRPASGMEHHVSHYWEMKLLAEGRPAVLHGTKVGVATLAAARLWQMIRGMSESEFQARLAAARLPAAGHEVAQLRVVFGPAAEGVIADHQAFLTLDECTFAALVARTTAAWAEIQRIAAQVPEPAELRATLAATGGPVTVRELGLTDEEGELGLRYGPYLRNRFTVAKLAWLLGIYAEPATVAELWEG